MSGSGDEIVASSSTIPSFSTIPSSSMIPSSSTIPRRVEHALPQTDGDCDLLRRVLWSDHPHQLGFSWVLSFIFLWMQLLLQRKNVSFMKICWSSTNGLMKLLKFDRQMDAPI